MDKLISKIRNKQVAFGNLVTMSSPEVIEVLAASGLDYVMIDQMFTSTDWQMTANMVRAAQARGISTLIRPESNPWVVGKVNRGQVAVETVRCLGVGATGVSASIHDPEELKMMLETAKDWHRQHHVIPFHEKPQNGKMTAWENHEKWAAENTLIVPIMESQTTLAEYEEMLAVDGLEAALFSGSDGARVLGLGLNYEHPALWKRLDEAVKICEKHDVALGCNTGYAFQDPESIAKRIKRLVEHGIMWVLIQTDGALLQFMYQNILAATKAELGSKYVKIGDTQRELTGRS